MSKQLGLNIIKLFNHPRGTPFYAVSPKNCALLFLSELRQISTDFNNFCEVDVKVAEIVCYIYIFHLT